MTQLSSEELIKLVNAVFPRHEGDRKLGILVDIPIDRNKDNPAWNQRREIAMDWFHVLKASILSIGLEGAVLIAFPDVGTNNGDLPQDAFFLDETMPSEAGELNKVGKPVLFEDVYKQYQLFLAPTEYSTTAPLKNAAKKYGFRAATMPGFAPEMIPALRVDYNEVSRRVSIIKEKVDAALWANVVFKVDNDKEYEMFFDLRYRESHLSSGRFPDQGTAGNLPSGETYIVPYEGEKGEISKTEGILPVQLGNDVAFFTIKENRARHVEGEGEAVEMEKDHLKREPAYGNMAELGFGVLGDFGLTPIGEILLDEKLGFHVAFGRSDHFGGAVGPKDFSSPKEVIHLDRIYIPGSQPRVAVKLLVFGYENNRVETIIKNGLYRVF
jgi:hypothetical protein